MSESKRIKTALVSVYHKEGLDEIITKLHEEGVEFLSTGGTRQFIESLGYPCKAVEDLTTYPSILGGRVKTLHPKIFGGILCRRGLEQDMQQIEKYEIPEIDLVIVDLYPFEATVASGASEADIIEKIDIGGISLIRAAAKNYNDVIIVASQAQYKPLLDMLMEHGATSSLEERRWMAKEAFAVSSHYDSAIFNYFDAGEGSAFRCSVNSQKQLRYGENPHQKGYFYGNLEAMFDQIHGKEISYNNLLDINAAVDLIDEFDDLTFAILKHNNACGLASAISSRHVDILHESIFIQIDENFHTAKYKVEYTIKSDVVGKQIPLLFCAVDYKDDFCVWLDDRPVKVFDIPFKKEEGEESSDSIFSDFTNSCDRCDDNNRKIECRWDDNTSETYYSFEMKYFQPKLSQGTHRIRVEYTAYPWRNCLDWITKYNFRYSLSPAKKWKSFGTLDITVEQAGKIKDYSSNLGKPQEGGIKQINTWHFDSLPENEFMELTYKPEPNSYAKILLTFGPEGLAAVYGIFLFLLHLKFITCYRKSNRQKRFSWVVILGSILVPFFILLFFIYSYSIIDFVIGKDASQRHGYIALIIIFYPIILPFYWVLMWLIDKRIKYKMLHQQEK